MKKDSLMRLNSFYNKQTTIRFTKARYLIPIFFIGLIVTPATSALEHFNQAAEHLIAGETMAVAYSGF